VVTVESRMQIVDERYDDPAALGISRAS